MFYGDEAEKYKGFLPQLHPDVPIDFNQYVGEARKQLHPFALEGHDLRRLKSLPAFKGSMEWLVAQNNNAAKILGVGFPFSTLLVTLVSFWELASIIFLSAETQSQYIKFKFNETISLPLRCARNGLCDLTGVVWPRNYNSVYNSEDQRY